jgi:hypothetical protein
VIATGNHFVFDTIGGLLAIALSVGIVALAERWRAGRRRHGEAPAEARARPTLRQSRAPGGLRTACHKLVTKSESG